MNACETFQPQFLNYLYGLLDEGDHRALAEHVEACAGCRAALAGAEGQRRLLGTAAKSDFSGVQFRPPAEPVEVVPTEARRKAVVARSHPVIPVWARWAIAASVLVFIGVIAERIGAAANERSEEIAKAEKHKEESSQEVKRRTRRSTEADRRAEDDIRAVQDEIKNLETERRRRRLQVRVTGPETIQAGARNQFLIHTENLVNEPVPAQVHVRLRDETHDQVVYEKKDLRSKGQCEVVLPADLPQKPGTRFALEVTAQGEKGNRIEVDARKLQLVAPLYLTHLTTDKPMYHPGEVVSFRSLTLERFSLKPVNRELLLDYRIANPLGAQVFHVQGASQVYSDREGRLAPMLGPDGKPIRGMGTGVYQIPPQAPGGVYTLSVTVSDWTGRPSLLQEQKRQFLVNQYEKPRLNKELEFTRKSYGPGDEVVAACKVSRVEGGKALADQPVQASVQVDGKTYDAAGQVAKGSDSGISLRTDAQGAVQVRFRLPARIDVGEASLALRLTDGQNHETLVRPIPVVLKKLQVEFFPEGGDLVAGVPNRVYFQVRTTQGKPAELKGRIVDAGGKVAASVATFHDDTQAGANQGMGVFALENPAAGAKYELKIDSPSGIEGRHMLPEVKADGVVLSIPEPVVKDTIPVVLHNGSAKRKLLVGAYCRGRLLDHHVVTLKTGEESKVDLKPQAGVGGVYRVTVFEELEAGATRLKPVAERLIYRQPAGRVNLSLGTDRARYTPREPVRVGLTAADEKGQPIPAILLVSVIDKSVLTLADEKTARSMPTHFYLMTEVRGPEDLEHADFLLSDHPRAGTALDLLLGTQGWRRFAEQQDPSSFPKKMKEQKKDAELLVLATGRTPLEKARVAQPLVADQDKFQPQINERGLRIGEIQQKRDRTASEEQGRIAEARVKEQNADRALTAAKAKQEDFWREVRGIGFVVLAVAFAITAIIAFVIGVVRATQSNLRSEPYIATAIGLFLLCAVTGVVGIASFKGDRPQTMVTEGHVFGAANGPAGNGFPAPRGMLADGDDMKKEAAGAKKGGEEKGEALAPEAPHGRRLAMEEMDQAANIAAKNAGPQEVRREQAKDVRLDGKAPPLMKKPVWGMRRPPALEGGDQAVPVAPEAIPAQTFVVREYAFRQQAARDKVRRDFTETLYWHPVLVLPNGKGDVSFDLCDSVTTFRVLALAHTLDGRLGAATTELESRLPLTLEPKIPVEVTAGDKVIVPLAVRNATDTGRKVRVQVETQGLENSTNAESELVVGPETGARRLYRLRPTIQDGQATVLFKGLCEPFAQDQIERTIRVVPDGFPFAQFKSELLEKSAEYAVPIPKTWVKGTLQVRVDVYPSTLADLQKGLESLLREPYGCFEQTSTSNYPNVLILDYLKESDQANPDVVRKARRLLDSGYQKLVSFECLDPKDQDRRGYEWFGGTAPPHEALTAYGLLQFRDMARVHPVDKAMVERTRKYLMGQRDGKGGFNRNPRALDSFGSAPAHITDAYIVWALTESGKEDDVDKELSALALQAKTSKDPYFLALVANSLYNRGRKNEGLGLLRALAAAQKEDGHLDGAETSVTRSGGRDLQIETTALTVLAWLKAGHPDFTMNLRKAAGWIGKQRGAFGGFGSTQATILALKALIAYTREYKKTAEAGTLILYVNDKEVSRKAFPAGTQDAITVTVPRPEEVVRPGQDNQVRAEITGKNVFPFTLSWSYRTVTPVNPANCPVHVSTRLSRAAADEADTVRLMAAVENRSGKDQGMAVAIIGLPGGLTLPEDMKQIKELVRPRDRGQKDAVGRYISAFEIKGRELVLYWRDLAKGEKIEVNLDLVCRVPGEYRGPASRAYLYYDADKKFWTEPLGMTIKARAEK
jgi:hypothetical protein